MKAKVFLSVFCGVLFGLMGWIILLVLGIDQAFLLALIAALLFGCMLFPFLIIYEKVMSKRYAQIESKLTSPVFFRTNGNFHLEGGKLRNGNIYFCEAGIVFACLEDKPFALEEIPLESIDRYTYTPTQLMIYTKDGKLFQITLPKADEIIDLLMRKGWITR